MKAQPRLGPALWWPRINSVFLTDVAVLVPAVICPAHGTPSLGGYASPPRRW